jgi:hypothetical protein
MEALIPIIKGEGIRDYFGKGGSITMIDPIGSNLSSIPTAQPVHPMQVHQAEEATAPLVEKPAVNIELSDETRAKMLEGQGSTIAEIALELDLDEITVRSYLIPMV